jgi:CelD/BcsL family acetyltransferase involved in cellulose biosynthesis
MMKAARLPFLDVAFSRAQAPDFTLDVFKDQGAARDFALVTEKSAFEAIGPEWRALFERSGQPHQVFQTFDWLWHWANHYLGDGAALAIVVGRREGRLALVWPFVRRRVFGLRILSPMGEPVSQYCDALVEQGPDAPALLAQALDFVEKLPVDIAVLRRVRDDAAIAPALCGRASRTGARMRAPLVDFEGVRDVAAFEKRFSAKLRSDRRRHLRRLGDLGAVAFERCGPGPRARDLVRIALGFKEDWARRNGRVAPALADPRFGRFFLDAAGGEAHAPDLRISAMSCGGEVIGVEISVACKGRVFGHVLAPKPGFEKQGAGAILAGHSIASALEEGFCAYDLLAPADAYKREWASGCVGVNDFALARTFTGRLFKRVWLDFGREAARTLLGRLARRLRPMSKAPANRD